MSAWLRNGGIKILVQVAGWIFLAGAAWVKLSALEVAVQKQDVKMEEIRSTTNQLSLSVTKIETRLEERIARADEEHDSYDKRLDRLERRDR